MHAAEWNENAKEGTFCDITTTDVRGVMARILKSLPLDKRRAGLIDLGCGHGSFIARFGRQFKWVQGYDFSEEMLRQAARRTRKVSGVKLAQRDLFRAGYPRSKPAGLVVCLNVATAPSPAKRKRVWQAIRESMSRRAFAIIVIPALESMKHVQECSRTRQHYDCRAIVGPGLVEVDDAQQKFFLKTEIDAELRRNGLKVQQLEKIWYPWADENLDGRYFRKVEPPWDWLVVARRA